MNNTIKQAVVSVEKLEDWKIKARYFEDDAELDALIDDMNVVIDSAEEVEPHAYTWIDDGKGSTKDLPLYLHPACKPQPEESGMQEELSITDESQETIEYWWCAHCKEEVDSSRVTFSEHHDTCGHPVEWITHRPDPPTELLSDQEIEGIFKLFVRKFYNTWGYEEGLHTNDLVDFARAIERKITEKNK